MIGAMNLDRILEQLDIPTNNTTVFLHISIDAIRSLYKTTNLLQDLSLYFDCRSTICMPSYPFFGGGYTAWARSDSVFDVKRTPSRVNLITELFRRSENVKRSLHPWCSVACNGYLASEFTFEHHLDTKTFGKKSPFAKILENGGIVVGLGVDCNTNSFAHMPDDIMLNNYNFEVYDKDIVLKQCVDYAGQSVYVASDLLGVNISKRIKPISMRESLLKTSFYKELNINNVTCYAVNIRRYVDFVVDENLKYVKKMGRPMYYIE